MFFNAEESEEEITPLFESSHQDNVAHLLDTLPPAFALKVLPTSSEINQFSSGEMVIIPLLGSIANALAVLPHQAPPPASAVNLACLKASVTGLSARLMSRPPAPPPSSFANPLANARPVVATLPSSYQKAKKKGKREKEKHPWPR